MAVRVIYLSLKLKNAIKQLAEDFYSSPENVQIAIEYVETVHFRFAVTKYLLEEKYVAITFTQSK